MIETITKFLMRCKRCDFARCSEKNKDCPSRNAFYAAAKKKGWTGGPASHEHYCPKCEGE